jgi:hypothetical protein
LKAVHHTLVSSAETKRAFNSDFDIGNLHRPTVITCFTPAVHQGQSEQALETMSDVPA